MFQDLILEYLKNHNIKMTELCEATGINRQNAYKAMKWSNLENPTLVKILEYLDLEISISLIKKHGKVQKIYRLPNHRIRANTNMDSFLFCWRNWDYYFAQKNRDTEIEVIEDVILTSIYNEKSYIDSDTENPWLFLQYA